MDILQEAKQHLDAAEHECDRMNYDRAQTRALLAIAEALIIIAADLNTLESIVEEKAFAGER